MVAISSVMSVPFVINILSILNNIYDINNTSFTIITSDFHLKRSTAILAEILGKDVQGIGIEDGITDNKNWTNTQIGRIQILKEALLLINSARKKEIEDLLVVLDFQIESVKSITKLLAQVRDCPDITLLDVANTADILTKELEDIYNNYQKISDVCEQCLTAIKIQENKSAQQQNKSEKQIK